MYSLPHSLLYLAVKQSTPYRLRQVQQRQEKRIEVESFLGWKKEMEIT